MIAISSTQLDLDIDYQSLAREIVRQLRGDLSQRELSDRLNYSFNKVGKWECGEHQIKWDDFIHLCQIQKAPLEKAFRDSFWLFNSEFNATTTLQALDDTFCFEKSRGIGASAPDLTEILRLIGKAPPALIGWLSLFLDCEKIQVLADPYKKLSVVIEVFSKDPVAVFVYEALKLEDYQLLSFHDERLLAEHSACTRPQLKTTLEHLLSNGLVRFDGQKYHPISIGYDISWLNHPEFRAVTHHATQHAARLFLTNPNPQSQPLSDNVSYASERTAALSTDAAIEVSKRILRFHNEAEEIISKDPLPKTNVQIILSQAYFPVAKARETPDQFALSDHEPQSASLTNTLTNLATVAHKSELKIDFASAAREILHVMRGGLSQWELSKKLGYTFNQVGKWESGATQFKWDKFIRVCTVLGIPIQNAFMRNFFSLESEYTPVVALQTLCHHFSAGINLDKQKRRTMEKWLRGKSVPDLAEVLSFMNCRTALMLTWLSEIVDCNQISSLREANKVYLARTQAVFRTPDAMLIYWTLHLDAYQKLENHEETFLTKHTMCSVTQVRQIIQILHLNGFVYFNGKKYMPIALPEIHSHNLEAVSRATQRIAQRFSIEPPPLVQDAHASFDLSVATARVVALSAQGSRLIRDLIWRYQSELGEIINRDYLPKQHLMTAIIHSYRSNTNAPNDSDS